MSEFQIPMPPPEKPHGDEHDEIPEETRVGPDEADPQDESIKKPEEPTAEATPPKIANESSTKVQSTEDATLAKADEDLRQFILSREPGAGPVEQSTAEASGPDLAPQGEEPIQENQDLNEKLDTMQNLVDERLDAEPLNTPHPDVGPEEGDDSSPGE